MNTVLFLDANETILDSIKYARSIGCKVITCDNNPSHEGHRLADVSYNISTYDVDALSEVVEKENVNAVVYFASAHGLYGGVRLIQKYGLPGIPYAIEKLFSDKGKFRSFLGHNKIDNPNYLVTSSEECNLDMPFPVIVKPVDSEGGNIGVFKVSESSALASAIRSALKVSFSRKVLIEQFIKSSLQVNGDCLIIDGKVELAYLGKYVYSSNDSIIPIATVFGDGIIPVDIYKRIVDRIQRVINASGMKDGVINVEIRVTEDGIPFFIEINPRHSGNRIYDLMDKSYGVSMKQIAVDLALGKCIQIRNTTLHGYYSYCILKSEYTGILDSLILSDTLRSHIISMSKFCSYGDEVHHFNLLKDRIALLHLSFDNQEQMMDIVNNLDDYYKVVLK
ncbi:ATP-grasp domain-containing protein [uncultured Bacteroides sp.]|uniref:ATP-grasp domain-containing protein n=1 Tax=uncultured Bacteroides sp. TaxID=162156 RepID=UPI002631D0EB|nr:ATP-grasp domain-containing protein [uncultured Bacteroides sp.]